MNRWNFDNDTNGLNRFNVFYLELQKIGVHSRNESNPFFKTQFLNSWSNKIICHPTPPPPTRIIVSEQGTEGMKLVQWYCPYILLFWDASSLCSLSCGKTWKFFVCLFKFLYTTTKTTMEKSPKPVIWLNQGTTETTLMSCMVLQFFIRFLVYHANFANQRTEIR